MIPKIFFFGTGRWSLNYFSLIEKRLKKIFNISCIITNNSNFKNDLYNTETSLEKAIINFGVPDCFILCTNPKSNNSILKKIYQFNKPIIVEKPIALSKDIDDLILNIPKKNSSKILVNHIHFYHEYFEKNFLELKNETHYKIKIIDGNKGPIRNYSPLSDWGPHPLGIASYYLGGIKNIKILKLKKLKYINPLHFNLYIKLSDMKENKIFDILIGNNFNYKKRTIFFSNKHFTKNFNFQDSLSLISPLENLLLKFHNLISNKSINLYDETLVAAINSSKIIQIIEKQLKL